MLIQLKQTEIETALKMYIASQGISLEGRTVDIAFTSGRGGNGLTADLDIHDTIGYIAPEIVVVPEEIPTNPIKRAPARSEEKAIPEETVVEEDVILGAPDDVNEQAPVEPKTSLFG